LRETVSRYGGDAFRDDDLGKATTTGESSRPKFGKVGRKYDVDERRALGKSASFNYGH